MNMEIPPFRKKAQTSNLESDSDSYEKSKKMEIKTLTRSKSKKELAEEVVFLRTDLRKSQVYL